MFMVAASVVTTILVLNYHHRQADTHEMPEWVSCLCSFFCLLSFDHQNLVHVFKNMGSKPMMASSMASTDVLVLYNQWHHVSISKHQNLIISLSQVQLIFLQYIPWFLRMSRPGEKITRKTIMMQKKMKEMEQKEISSKSLLANVLDIDDNFRSSTLPHGVSNHPSHVKPPLPNGCSVCLLQYTTRMNSQQQLFFLLSTSCLRCLSTLAAGAEFPQQRQV